MFARRMLLAAVIAVTAACEKTNTEPTTSSDPNTFTFVAELLPSNEVPPVTNADASGRGTVTVTLTVTRDSADAITAATMAFNVSLNSFPNGTSLTGAHIHEAFAGSNGGVKVSTGLSSGEIVLTSGPGGFNKSASATPAVAQAVIGNPSGYSVNVHTTLNPGGAVRGQLVKQ